jgi:hypothetical protein
MSDKGSALFNGQSLRVNDYLQSPNGRYQADMQPDGNFVLYDLGKNHKPIWSSKTNGQAASVATMQGDGNFVIYGFSNNAIFATKTQGQPNAFMQIQDDGNLVIYRHETKALWASRTQGQ